MKMFNNKLVVLFVYLFASFAVFGQELDTLSFSLYRVKRFSNSYNYFVLSSLEKNKMVSDSLIEIDFGNRVNCLKDNSIKRISYKKGRKIKTILNAIKKQYKNDEHGMFLVGNDLLTGFSLEEMKSLTFHIYKKYSRMRFSGKRISMPYIKSVNWNNTNIDFYISYGVSLSKYRYEIFYYRLLRLRRINFNNRA